MSITTEVDALVAMDTEEMGRRYGGGGGGGELAGEVTAVGEGVRVGGDGGNRPRADIGKELLLRTAPANLEEERRRRVLACANYITCADAGVLEQLQLVADVVNRPVGEVSLRGQVQVRQEEAVVEQPDDPPVHVDVRQLTRSSRSGRFPYTSPLPSGRFALDEPDDSPF
ncbi:hypothetical protein TYRP_017281 [Tyrophagus putrescentiae]|nr:hypothetical protein TYRP_017281 [Tyrophagus putrescentiae]